jgi:CRISPR-associated endonuclease Csn1
VEKMPLPWKGFHQQVAQSLAAIKVSFRPDHGYQGEIFDSTVYGLLPDGSVTYRQEVDGIFTRPPLNRDVVKFADATPKNSTGALRHGIDDTDSPKPYMGLWSRSNYCIDIINSETGSWRAEVVPRYVAYKIVNNKTENESRLKSHRSLLTSQPIVFRLMIDDVISIQDGDTKKLLRVTKISAANGKGGITCTELHESNTSNRYLEKLKAKKLQKENKPFDIYALNDDFLLTQFSPSALKNVKAKKVTISPIGIVTYHQRKK